MLGDTDSIHASSHMNPTPARAERDAGPAGEARALPLLIDVLQSLRTAGVRACYWKSSRRLDAVLRGESDLDLLVARAHQHTARQVFAICGLKAFYDVASRAHPAVESYLGYDETSGRLVHVHAHFCLALGPRVLKHYRFAVEDAVLAASVPHPALPLRMLDPDTEAVLLAVRMSLDLRRDDPVTLLHWKATTAKFAADRAALAKRTSRESVRQRAAALLNEDLADAIAELICGAGSGMVDWRLRRRISGALAAYRRVGTAEALLLGAWHGLTLFMGRVNRRYLLLPRPSQRRAPGGGIVVVALGVDGSGKTTLTRALREWLGSEVDVLPMYFGTGDGRPSLLLLPFKLLVPLVSRLVPTRPRGSSHGSVSDQAPGPLYSVLMMGWAAMLALEKRRKLLAAHRAASRGMVVIADRYPQDQILDFNDGPLLPRLHWAPRWLRRYETQAYALARQLSPDLVLKLEAPVETLARREPSMDLGVIRERAAMLQLLTFQAARTVSVDTTQPLETVIRTAKAEIWRCL